MINSVSIVIPVYNSAEILPELLSQLSTMLSETVSDYEIILVNDGSRDQSWEIIRQLSDQYPFVIGIDLMRNYGQHNALLAGIFIATKEAIVTMDDDLQHPPEEVPKLLEELSKGYDVVYGTPMKEQHGLWRDLASLLTKLTLQNTLGVAVARNVGAFRAFKTHIREAFRHFQNPYVNIDVLLTWGAARYSAIPTKHNPRLRGVSHYTFRKLLTHAINMTIGFSTFPLRFASFLGFFFVLFGIGILIYVVGRYFLEGGKYPGFPFLASTIAIFSGAQLFALGIIGEYLARMFYNAIQKPVYTIREKVQSQ